MRGTVTEGAAPQCKTTFEGHGSHRSDRERPVHSSERQERAREACLIKLIVTLTVFFFKCKRKWLKLQNRIHLQIPHNYFFFNVYDTWEVVPGAQSVSFTQAWSSKAQKMISDSLTLGKQSESTNVWRSKLLHEKTFVWSWKRHRQKSTDNRSRFFIGPKNPRHNLGVFVSYSFSAMQPLTDNNRQCHVTRSHALEPNWRMAVASALLLSFFVKYKNSAQCLSRIVSIKLRRAVSKFQASNSSPTNSFFSVL